MMRRKPQPRIVTKASDHTLILKARILTLSNQLEELKEAHGALGKMYDELEGELKETQSALNKALAHILGLEERLNGY